MSHVKVVEFRPTKGEPEKAAKILSLVKTSDDEVVHDVDKNVDEINDCKEAPEFEGHGTIDITDPPAKVKAKEIEQLT